MCRHVYPAGGRCLGPEEAERHHTPRLEHISPEFHHEFVAGALIPWPPDYGAMIIKMAEKGIGLKDLPADALVALVGAALGVDDDN